LNKVRPVIKPNGSLRLTANFIALNNLVILDKYSLPDMMEMLYKLNDKVYKTKIDLKDGFYQIHLHPEDRHKTAFRIKNRLYEWTRMPMGFKNSPAVFQRFMDTILCEEIGRSCFVYVDDILVFGRTKKELDEGLRRVLKKLIKAGLIANKDKIELSKTEITFLGHRLLNNKIISELDNGQAIKDLKKLNNVEEVRRFLGTVNYYRKFIENCANKLEP
ncbi:Retrovirus-related Pol polyprotein from transposon opus, partial [Nosema granulosis]